MRGPLRQRQRRRRIVAIATAMLWLIAVEVLPNLHLAFHQHDHTHRQDGTIVWLSRGSHHDAVAHAGDSHRHPASHAHGRDAVGGRDDHDAHDHRGLAYLDPEALGAHGEVVLADRGHAALDDLDHEALGDHGHVVLADHALADHDHASLADHDHDALGYHDHDAPSAASATGDSHDAGHRHDPRRKRSDHVAFEVVPLGHAAAGIAHHAVALLDPPPPLLQPVSAPEPQAWSLPAPRTLVESRFHARPNARGPPAV